MAFVGLFLGGSPGALIASGQSVLNLQWQAENRQDTAGASFTVTGPGVNKTIPARADGRAEITVPVGTFTVSVTHKGAYLGDDPTTVITESQKSYLVFFDGKVDRSAEINALGDRITSNDNDISSINSRINSYGDSVRKDYTTSVSSGDSRLVTSDAVYQAIINTRELKGTIMIQRYTDSQNEWPRLARVNRFNNKGLITRYRPDASNTTEYIGTRDIQAGGVTIRTIPQSKMYEGVVQNISYYEIKPGGATAIFSATDVTPLVRADMQGTGTVRFEFIPQLVERRSGSGGDWHVDKKDTTKLEFSFNNGVLTRTSIYGAYPATYSIHTSSSLWPDPSTVDWDVCIRTLLNISVS